MEEIYLKYIKLIFLSMLPIIELRGDIPLGITMELVSQIN